MGSLVKPCAFCLHGGHGVSMVVVVTGNSSGVWEVQDESTSHVSVGESLLAGPQRAIFSLWESQGNPSLPSSRATLNKYWVYLVKSICVYCRALQEVGTYEIPVQRSCLIFNSTYYTENSLSN